MAIDFAFVATNECKGHLKDYRGQWVVLYFYPKDNTPGCTLESKDFCSEMSHFEKLNATIFGISRDSLQSHEKFKENLSLPFELISDEGEHLCNQFDVIKMKNMYGKQVRGVERSTFIISPKGEIAHEWRKVKVKGHAEDVKQTLAQLQKA